MVCGRMRGGMDITSVAILGDMQDDGGVLWWWWEGTLASVTVRYANTVENRLIPFNKLQGTLLHNLRKFAQPRCLRLNSLHIIRS